MKRRWTSPYSPKMVRGGTLALTLNEIRHLILTAPLVVRQTTDIYDIFCPKMTLTLAFQLSMLGFIFDFLTCVFYLTTKARFFGQLGSSLYPPCPFAYVCCLYFMYRRELIALFTWQCLLQELQITDECPHFK